MTGWDVRGMLAGAAATLLAAGTVWAVSTAAVSDAPGAFPASHRETVTAPQAPDDRWARYVGWRACVQEASGSDSSMHECDESWTVPSDGDGFDMRPDACVREAWLADDPDAAMLAVCER